MLINACTCDAYIYSQMLVNAMREYTATVKLDRQKRITIPKAIRDEEGLEPGDVIEVIFRIREKSDEIGERGNADAQAPVPAFA